MNVRGVTSRGDDEMGDEPKEKFFESYKVREIAGERIAAEIPEFLRWKWVDAFADPETSQFEEFWDDALAQNWDEAARQGNTLWVIPPIPNGKKFPGG